MFNSFNLKYHNFLKHTELSFSWIPKFLYNSYFFIIKFSYCDISKGFKKVVSFLVLYRKKTNLYFYITNISSRTCECCFDFKFRFPLYGKSLSTLAKTIHLKTTINLKAVREWKANENLPSRFPFDTLTQSPKQTQFLRYLFVLCSCCRTKERKKRLVDICQ